MLDTGLDNPLLADPDLNLGDFNQPSVNGIDLSGITDDKPPPVVEGDDGNLYRSNAYLTPSGWKTDPDFSEPVYYYTQSSELGDVYDWRFDVTEDGRVDQQGSYFTKDQIQEFWEADQGMGYFQQQNPNLDFDTYMAFVAESSDLQRQGFTNAANGAEYDALTAKYGIQTTYQNDDGDVFQFNGSNYTKTSKVDDSFDAGGLIMSLAVSYMTGGLLGNPLTALLGQAGITGSAAVAATNAITNMATQLVTTGGVDMKQALISAAVSYGGDKLGNAFANSTELDGVLGDMATTAQESVTKFNDLISTGNSVVDAAIQAGGIDMLSQLVINGEVDLEQAATSALVAAGTEGFKKLNSLTQAGGGGSVELEEIVVTAQKKGTDLGNGLYELNGVVFSTNQGDNYGYLGNMADIDTDGDGAISANDLQNITTNNQTVPTSITPRDPNTYYDTDGDGKYTEGVDRLLDVGSNTIKGNTPYDLSNPDYTKQLDNFSDSQLIDALDRQGVKVLTREDGSLYLNPEADIDPAIASNVSDYLGNRNQETYIKMNRVHHGNGIYEFKDQEYSVGVSDSGQEYIVKTNPDGSSSLKMISADDHATLADMADNENYAGISEYLNNKGLSNGGTIYSDYNPNGAQVLYNPDGTLKAGSNGGVTTTPVDDWIVLDEAVVDNAVQVTFPPKNPNDPNPTDTDNETGGNNTSSTSNNNGTSQSTSTSDSNAATTAEDFTLPQIRTIANATNTTIQSVINALNEGQSPQEILAANDVSPSTLASDPANSSDGNNSTATDTTTDKTSDGTEGTSTSGTTQTGSTTDTTPGNTAVGVTPGQEATGPTTFSVGPSVWNTGGTQSGSGTNEGEGEGEGEGDGEGDGSGLGAGGKGGGGNNVSRGSYTPSWSPLFATNQFRKFNKNRGNNKAMAALQPNTNLSAPKADFSQSRLNLFSDLIKDLK